MMKRLFLFILATNFCAYSCKQQEEVVVPLQSEECSSEITMDDALASLYSFFDVTKSGAVPQIESVECHYSESLLTKGLIHQKDAYIVNFVDDGGFAVLGANTSIPRIVCVVDKAHIDAEDLSIIVRDEGDCAVSHDSDDIPEDFEWYCSEDDDYYSISDKEAPVKVRLFKRSDAEIFDF